MGTGISLALAAWVLTALACSSPTPLTSDERRLYSGALERWLDRMTQLQTINQRIRRAGAELCGDDLSPVFGVVLLQRSDLPDTLRPIADERMRGDEVLVEALIEGFPAERAGVKVGDQIIALDEVPIFSPRRVYGAARSTNPTIAMRIARDGAVRTLELENVPGCDYRASLVDTEAFNAYADGEQVVFFNGLMRTIKTDEAIALIMGHEIAHNIQTNTTGQRSGGVVGEARADYIGAYLAERAGYRLARDDFGLAQTAYAAPRALESKASTHPTGPARLLAFERTLAEIALKRANEEPLVPGGL